VVADASAKSLQSRTLLRQLPGSRPTIWPAWRWQSQAGRSRPKRKRPVTRAGALVVSRTDRYAALISHGPGQQARLKHKVLMAVDGGRSRLGTSVTAVPAGHSDGQGPPAILDEHQVTDGSPPQEVVAATAYATVTTFQAGTDRSVTASIPSCPDSARPAPVSSNLARRAGSPRDRVRRRFPAAPGPTVCCCRWSAPGERLASRSRGAAPPNSSRTYRSR